MDSRLLILEVKKVSAFSIFFQNALFKELIADGAHLSPERFIRFAHYTASMYSSVHFGGNVSGFQGLVVKF